MVVLKTTSLSVTLNDFFTDNKGTFSYIVNGNTITLRPKNHPSVYPEHFSQYQCDGSNFQSVLDLTQWLDDNLFYDGGGSGEGLQKATSSDVAAGTDDTKYVTAKSVNEFVVSATQGEMANYINVLSATALTFNESGFYTFNGSASVTWALKPVSGNQGLHYYVKNIGSANLNITGVIYFTSSVSTIALAPGDAIIIHNNTSNWTIQ